MPQLLQLKLVLNLAGEVGIAAEIDTVGDECVGEVVSGLEQSGLRREQVGNGAHSCPIIERRKAIVLLSNI